MRIIDWRGAVASSSSREIAQRAAQFVRNSFPVDRRNTRFVALARVRPIPRGWTCTTVTKVPGQRARSHRVLVYPKGNYVGPFDRCPHVRTDCDCSRYTFVWNYALGEAGLAIRDRTNGEPPIETNPGQRLGICKHGIVVLQYLIKSNPHWPHAGVDEERNDGAVRLTTQRDARRRK